MRIGIDARMYGAHFTGIGRYCFELIRNLARLDTENDYVIFLRKEAFDTFIPPNPRFTKVLADFGHYSFGEQTGFLRLLNAQSVDLMHFTHFNAPVFYRRPFVVTIHDLTLTFYPGKKMNTFLHRMAYRFVIRSVTKNARRVIAVSEHTKKDLQETLGVPADKIEVVYNGVSPEFGAAENTDWPGLSRRLGIARPFFLYTGVWRDHKNVTGMIRAFAKFNAETGHRHDLVITGKPNPAYREVPDTVAALGLAESVCLVGMVSEPDLAALYRHAAAYVFPSFYEGFGLPPLEAMQSGTPVIASNTSAIPEICGEGNALYFDPCNPDDMAEKMRVIIADDSVRQQLIDRGLSRVRQFTWEKAAGQVLSIYHSVL